MLKVIKNHKSKKAQEFARIFLITIAVMFISILVAGCDDTPRPPLGDIVKMHIEGPDASSAGAPIFSIYKISTEGVKGAALASNINPPFAGAQDRDVIFPGSLTLTEGEAFVIEFNGSSGEITRTYTFYNGDDEVVCTKKQTRDTVAEIAVSTSDWNAGDEYTEFLHNGNDIKMTQKALPATE